MGALDAQRDVAGGVQQASGRGRVARRRARGRAVGGHLPSDATDRRGPYPPGMSPFWIWTQGAVVVFVLIGIVIAIVKLA